MSEEMQLALEHTLKTMRELKEAADTITTLRAEVERLGKKLNVARYGEPDFAWSIYEAQMVDLRATNERLRAALKDIRDHSLELYATGVARAALTLPASLRNRMAVLVENIDVDLDSAIDGDVAL